MRVVIQRAKNAKCTVDGQITGQIDHGYCIFVGFNNEDTNEIIDKMIHKILFLRIFEDENGKMNKSIQDVEGSILSISQFTLYADCKKGNQNTYVCICKSGRGLYNSIFRCSKLRKIPRTKESNDSNPFE